MERESFENEAIAQRLNSAFVSIKVDREERPDLDDIYMRAVQAMTGAGGWPMSVFLTPDLEPFFGGTYFPPEDRHGRPGFASLLDFLTRLWTEDRERALKQGRALADSIREQARVRTTAEIDPGVLDRSLEELSRSYDPAWGGFGPAPKFPHATDLRLCLRHGRRTGEPRATAMAIQTLDRMAAGGIRDHLAGGFARYSTDERWLIPHFEKMLYDNALLVPAYLEAFTVTGEERHGRVARETCDWVLRDMVTAEGAFASALDADSEGVEGKAYVWTPEELAEVLGPEHGRWAAAWFGVTEQGNFEHGTSALWRPDPPQEVAERLGVALDELEAAMEDARAELLAVRDRRVQPAKDDKVLAAWNGLMISALAQAHQVLGEPRYLEAARRAARYVLDEMRDEHGRLLATARHGTARLGAYLDDHAFLIQGCLDLFESDFDPDWLRAALALNDDLSERFEDREHGGYFMTGSDHEQLLTRLKSTQDGALPAGSGVQALNLLRLAQLTGDPEPAVRAERTIRSLGELVNRFPRAFSSVLLAVDALATGPREIVVAGERGDPAFEELLRTVRTSFAPLRVVAHGHPSADAELMPVVGGKTAPEGTARVFVCRDQTCGLPVQDPEALAEQLGQPQSLTNSGG